MNKNVIIRVAPLMGILCIEAAICVLSLYDVTIILGYGTPSFYSILVAGLKAIALIALIGTSVFSLLFAGHTLFQLFSPERPMAEDNDGER